MYDFFGAIGGAFWALIPAILKTKFNTNEILTSLMLTYIAILILDYFVLTLERSQWIRLAQIKTFPMLEDYPHYMKDLEFI